ncbi:MAG: cytochrome b N-terminal domain-containing protein [Nitrospirae bacterium]|nr:cytochrome b N-terminal domain-containing protein [Nitrospirota bacterium]
MKKNRLLDLLTNNRFYKSVFRHDYPDNDISRSEVVTGNLLLHIQSVKVHKNTIRTGYTLGLGLISFYLFVILTITGILLMFYYIPSLERAYNDMKDLEFAVSYGIILRNLHRWGAHGMVAFVFLHMCRVFYTGGYKQPREFNWGIGVVLLIITLFLSLTGYLLPWDQLAFWAITIVAKLIGTVPPESILGANLSQLVLGGTIVGQNALIRFYVMHVVVLPLVAAVLIGVHFWRIRKDGGLSRPAEE